MLFCIQQLVIRQNSMESYRPTLTDLHDTDTAWAGLGGAMLTLWRQKKLPRNPLRVVLAAVYLIGIAALHTTVPAIISIKLLNQSIPTEVPTSGLPIFAEAVDGYHFNVLVIISLHSPELDVIYRSTNMVENRRFHGQNVLPYVGKGKNDQTIGLLGSLVYDIPEDNNMIGSLDVRGTQFNVTCGTLSQGLNTLHSDYHDNNNNSIELTWESSNFSNEDNWPIVSFDVPIGEDSCCIFLVIPIFFL
jgi:hypothetical protein